MPTAKSTSTTDGIVLSWSMSRDKPDQLDITYSVENTTDHTIYVCDSYAVSANGPNTWRRFPGISVTPMRDPADTAKMVIGTPSNELPQKPRSHFEALEPGETFEGARQIKYPLEGRGPTGGVLQLPSSVDKAQLTVYALDKEPASWAELPAADGSTLRVPRNFKPLLLTAGPAPLP